MALRSLFDDDYLENYSKGEQPLFKAAVAELVDDYANLLHDEHWIKQHENEPKYRIANKEKLKRIANCWQAALAVAQKV